MKNCKGIYKIEYNNQCIYVGQSINIKDRINGHKRKLRKDNHDNKYLQRLYNKHGNDFIYSVIEEVGDVYTLTQREMYWIDKLNPICNMQIPSDSTFFTITEESRKRMSIATKSRMTNEMKLLISKRTKEAMARPDVRYNFIKGQNNKTNKVAWNKGLKGLYKAPNRKKVFCIELNINFDSAFEAGLYVGAKDGKGVSRVCGGQRNKYKNMHWYYI